METSDPNSPQKRRHSYSYVHSPPRTPPSSGWSPPNGFPEVKILSQPPPHPLAVRKSSVDSTDGPSKQQQRNRLHSNGFRERSNSNDSISSVSKAVVRSAPPPKKWSTGSSCYEEDDGVHEAMVTIRFEVTVAEKLKEEEVLRMTGNAATLGKWDVLNSVPLQKSSSGDGTWSVEVEVPADWPVQYRYMVVNGNDKGGFRIVSWEAHSEPRNHVFSKTQDLTGNTVQEQYGTNEGVSMIDGGWLVKTSELHLQLGTLGAALSISNHSDHTHYLITAHTFSTQPNKELDCSPFKAKLLSRTSGDCVTFDLSAGGCPYDQRTNVLVFTTESPDFQDIGVSFDVYTCDPSTELPTPLPSSSCKVGRASLLPRQYLGDTSRGNVVLTVFSEDLVPVGTLSLSFLLVHPTGGLVHSAKHSNCWKKHKRMLHIGHRGLGDSYHTELKPTVTENTISSLKIAGNHGADYVEFDVQLTKDQVPVVYHNFMVCTTLAREGYFSGELLNMPVKDLTLHQLQSLKLDHSSVLVEKNQDTPDSPNSSSSEYGSSNETYWGAKRFGGATYRGHLPEKKTFPTLAQLFEKLPSHIGFDVELKYPLPERDSEGQVQEDYQSFDINLFADAVLSVVHRHAGDRKVLFTCFNPDMCTVLRRKQSSYPVLLLTSALNPQWGVPLDVRGRTLNDAAMHAKAENLLGLVCDSVPLLKDPSLVRSVRDKNLVLFSWGLENNDLKNIETQNQAGVDAVIYDCIHTLLPGPQKNVFLVEQEQQAERRRSLGAHSSSVTDT